MTDEKRLAAERLFDAVGELDDNLLDAALNFKKPRAKILTSRPFISTLSAVAAVLVLAVLVFPRMNSADESNMERSDTDIPTLTSALEQADYSGVTTLSSTDEVDLFDETPKIIWQYTGAETCYTVDITHSDLNRLINYASYAPNDTAPDDSCRIWLTAGDGLVVSPCLKRSAGNVGYGNIFDYSPELSVSGSFAANLAKLIT